MATCDECGDVMGKAKTCTHLYKQFGAEFFKRNTIYFDINKRCHDCGIMNKEGNIHHAGCDMERCPRCDGQLIGCGCVWESCNGTCGDWEKDGCEKDHAGALYLIPPNGIITTYTKERQRAIMKRRSKEMMGWVYEHEHEKDHPVPKIVD